MKYSDFDLAFERSGDRYRVRILNSPSGQAEGEFDLPFAELEVENFLLKIGRPMRKVRRVDAPELESTKNFGGRLFDAVFNNEVRGCFRSSLDEALRNGGGLRIRLRLSNIPELADLPWEYLYNPALNRFFSLSKETPIIRYLDLPERVRPFAVSMPLRVLVMISSPYNYPRLDVEREWHKLKEVLSDLEQQGLVILDRLDKATLVELQRLLRQKEYHVFHFIGHGGFEQKSQDGILVLEDEKERGRTVSGQYLGAVLHNHQSLRLAILNACEGGRTSRTDPFSGAAQSLVQQGIPAVIAMQFEITDEAAITFAREFYTALADNYPVDTALVEARTAIFAHGNNVEWGTPVLYLRAPDGKIFDIAAAGKKAKKKQAEASLLAAAQIAGRSVDELPKELVQAIAHPIPEVREGVVKVLEGLLGGVHRELGLRAEEALKKLALDDSRKVVAAAQTCLTRYYETLKTQEQVADATATDIDGVITIDEHGTIERFNSVAERIFGFTAAEALQHEVSILMPSPDRERHQSYVANYVKTGEKKIIGKRREVLGQRKDGTTFPMDISVTEALDGEKRFFTAIVQDITARKRAEEELHKTQALAEAGPEAKPQIRAAPVGKTLSKFSSVTLRLGGVIGLIFILAVGAYLWLRPQSEPEKESFGGRAALEPNAGSDSTKGERSNLLLPSPLQPETTRVPPKVERPVAKETSSLAKEPSSAPKSSQTQEGEASAGRDNAVAAQQTMLTAKQSVSGSTSDKSANADYQSAEQLGAAAAVQLQAGEFRSAQTAFEQASRLYDAAAASITRALKQRVESAQAAMREAKDKAERAGVNSVALRPANEAAAEGDRAYETERYEKAEEQFQSAKELYLAAASELQDAQARLAQDQNAKRAALDKKIDELAIKCRTAFEQEEIKTLKNILLFSENFEAQWSGFFKQSEDIKADWASENGQMSETRATVEVAFMLQFGDNKNQKQNITVRYAWTLTLQSGAWVLSSVTVLK